MKTKQRTIQKTVGTVVWFLAIISLLGTLAVPARGGGMVTHGAIADRAIAALAALPDGTNYSALKTLLETYRESVRSGARFPDWVYGYASQFGFADADAAHDTYYLRYPRTNGVPVFRAALTAELLPRFRNNPRSVDDEKAIAFLFGLISHQEADMPWHWTPAGETGMALEDKALQDFELSEQDIDALVPYPDAPDLYCVSLSELRNAYSATTNQMPQSSDMDMWATEQTAYYVLINGQSQIPVTYVEPFPGYGYWWWGTRSFPFGGTKDQFRAWLETYRPGGLQDCAEHTVMAWQETFRQLVNTSPPVFAGCSVPAPGQFRLKATGTAGLTYTVQTSTNLMDWVNHTNLIADLAGLIECLEDMETSAPACFYRLKWP